MFGDRRGRTRNGDRNQFHYQPDTLERKEEGEEEEEEELDLVPFFGGRRGPGTWFLAPLRTRHVCRWHFLSVTVGV